MKEAKNKDSLSNKSHQRRKKTTPTPSPQPKPKAIGELECASASISSSMSMDANTNCVKPDDAEATKKNAQKDSETCKKLTQEVRVICDQIQIPATTVMMLTRTNSNKTLEELQNQASKRLNVNLYHRTRATSSPIPKSPMHTVWPVPASVAGRVATRSTATADQPSDSATSAVGAAKG
jgi:hypothetical protein